MADKQATIYIVDLGASTGECHNGRVESDLDYGMRYVWDKLAETMAANRTTFNISVIGFRTDDTKNDLAAEDEYGNISVLKPLGPMHMSHLKNLQEQIKANKTNEGDAVSAIVVAIDSIDKFTTLKSGKPGKYGRTIVLVTDGQGLISDEDIDPIAQKINESGIELKVVGVDFDDLDFGFKEEDKSSEKKRNEKILKDLTDKCSNNLFATAAEAISQLSIPKVKSITRFLATYKGKLTLGDLNKCPETAMAIDIERYSKTKAQKPISASNFVTRSAPNDASSQLSSATIQGDVEMSDAPLSGDFAAVKTQREYKINDQSGGKTLVDHEELAKGYEYGRTAVPFTESDENITKLNLPASFEIIGFIPNDKYERFLNMGESCITVASKANDKASIALSSLVHALFELESYAVARMILKEGKDPQILLLAPLIEPDVEALIDVQLPFAEDLRVYRFPPLDRVITTSGTTLTKHRNLPTEDLTDAMSDYVDSMDLSTFGRDDENQPTEYMPIEETYSPLYHRINQAIKQRAVLPNDPIRKPAEILVKYSNPPPDLVSASASQLNKLIKAAEVKKVPPKVKGKRARKEINPISNLNIEALLTARKRQRISADNAIPEFIQSLQDGRPIPDVVSQMKVIIRDSIKSSFGANRVEISLSYIRVLREQMLELEEPRIYNDFIRELKGQLLNPGKLGNDRREVMLGIRRQKLGLIDEKTDDGSDVTEKEAAEFYSLGADLPNRSEEN